MKFVQWSFLLVDYLLFYIQLTDADVLLSVASLFQKKPPTRVINQTVYPCNHLFMKHHTINRKWKPSLPDKCVNSLHKKRWPHVTEQMNITIKLSPKSTMGNSWSKMNKSCLCSQKSALLQKAKKGLKGSFGH